MQNVNNMQNANKWKIDKAWVHFGQELGFNTEDVSAISLQRRANGDTVVVVEFLIEPKVLTKYLSGFSDHGEWHFQENEKEKGPQ